jgi:hypothetical protein
MGRSVALLLVWAAVGCTDGDAPPLLNADLGADLSVSVEDGGACMTACDCRPGLACVSGRCEAASVMVFCCSSASCSGSSVCQFPNGNVGQCDRADAGGVPPVVDGGAPPSACQMRSCTRGVGGDLFCKLACGGVNATCVRTGGIEHCMP